MVWLAAGPPDHGVGILLCPPNVLPIFWFGILCICVLRMYLCFTIRTVWYWYVWSILGVPDSSGLSGLTWKDHELQQYVWESKPSNWYTL